MDQDFFEKLARSARTRIIDHEGLFGRPTYKQIGELVDKLLLEVEQKAPSFSPLSNIDRVRLLKLITDDYDVQVGEPLIAVSDKDLPRWFDSHKHEIEWKHWYAYRKMLEGQGRSKAVIDENEQVIDAALDFAGDPRTAGPWSRKGLVMGNVQSGKTQNYLGLINKAIDAGYRTIIVLGGHLNDLRMQTQERVDEGVLGRNSRHLVEIATTSAISIGVGPYYGGKGPIPITAATTTKSDFNKAFAGSFGVNLTQKEPVIFTIKKHTTVLKALTTWIQETHGTGLDGPMLLIDDEADYASINTKVHKDEVTATNEIIRTLLSLFNRSAYVAYTATPFANIFIDPDEAESGKEDDLFPSDFMIKMPVPSNYIGQDFFFGEDVLSKELSSESPLVEICDHEPIYKLKSKDEIDFIPDSLKDAVRAFMIAIAVRTLRGEQHCHNTMLVNISHLSAHQNSLEYLIDSYKRQLVENIDSFGSLGMGIALSNKSILDLKTTYDTRFYIDEGFDKVLEVLAGPQRRDIKVWAINQSGTVRDRHQLNYSTHKEYGLNVIVIGGHKLSRGLTLEGLTISYFARNSKAYDTLMQMCRWFGYRPTYKDLCKVFLPEESITWYAYIASTIKELYGELELMAGREDRPRDFGLKVREHPGSMIVSAKNKIGYAKSEFRHHDLWGQVQRRYRFFGDKKINEENTKYVDSFLSGLLEDKSKFVTVDGKTGATTISNVDYSTIFGFVKSVNLPEDDLGNKILIKQLKIMEERGFSLPKVMLFNQSGSSTPKWEENLSLEDKTFINKPYQIAGHSITLAKRAMAYKEPIYQTSSVNLGNKGDEKFFLTEAQRAGVTPLAGRKDAIDQDYIAAKGRDFAGLKIYYFAVTEKVDESKPSALAHGHSPTVGYSVSFPRPESLGDMTPAELRDFVKSTSQRYLLNKVHEKHKELADYNDIEDE